ncbi:hypothetical protein J437_LFUL017315 [Ladona fulva]|uniref:DDE-1 domain-containing protein n=1 Tax=Ladona fulva TaxID=123851 RepID=A0A8K0KQC3_LADFU|nr:hypothetical protein J437_LFUL017315 [Ladona fulva]
MIKIWLDNVWKKRKHAFFSPKSVLIMDACRAHLVPEVKKLIQKYSKLAITPGGLMKKLRPLDLKVNKSSKSKLRAKWEEWMIAGVHEYTNSGKMKRPSYEEIYKWISESWNSVTVTCIQRGFHKSFGDMQDTETTESENDEVTEESKVADVPVEILIGFVPL